MSQVIGIDLGTTYCCMAYLEGEEARVIPNQEGQLTTPSVVSFTTSGEKLIGNLALRQAITNSEKTIFAIKRFMGKKFGCEEVREARKRLPYRLAEASNGDVTVAIDSQMISPQEISAMILGYLKQCAEAYLGEKVEEAIITVPAHFNDHQRQATKDAAKIAGLNVLRVLNEPTSASLGYGLNTRREAMVAVYDLGGGTFDITLMEISEGIFNVLATNGSSFLGGEDFDDRIVNWVIEEFRKETQVDLSEDKLALQRIKEACEKAKRELSFTMESRIHLPFICSQECGSKHFDKAITRGKLEALTEDLVEKTFPFIQQAMEDSKLKPEGIDDIIMVGGQTRMPLVKKKITEFFGKEPIHNINPDEIVAIGAAVQSGILRGKMSDLVVLLDVTPISLGIETESDSFQKIIDKNTTIPVKKTMPFTTVEHNQKRVRIHVLQGESDKASDNTSLAVFDLVGIETAPAGVPQIDVTFEIDADGLVKVSAKDAATGREQRVEVRPSSGLGKQEVNKIIHRSQA
ncbi:MAG: molecular chaperone DnaK [Candidatus Aminicenantes bacterium]